MANIHLREIGWFTEIEINRNLYTPFPNLSFISERNDVNHIHNQLEALDADKFLKDTKLGFQEEKLKDTVSKKILRRLNSKLMRLLIGDGNLEKIHPWRIKLILASLRIKQQTALLPSRQELIGKFYKLTEEIYKSKHQ